MGASAPEVSRPSPVCRGCRGCAAASRPHEREHAAEPGEAGAIDHFGRRHGLPRAHSGHNNYWLWGPPEASGRCVIVLGAEPEELEPLCETVEHAAVFSAPYVMPYEDRLPIDVCRGLRVPFATLWPATKSFQ